MRTTALATLTVLAAPVAAQADLTDRFDVPEGQRVTLFAESPMLFNPTAIDVDRRGRVWVAEGVNYRKWNRRNVGRKHEDGDRIVILEDRDGDGRAESSKVFVQDDDLTSPLGIAVLGHDVYVSCSPNLIKYTDADGDDVPESKEIVLTGFGGFDHDHGLHSIVAGPDGALYFNVGNAGPHVVTDRGGWTLRSGSYQGGGARADAGPGSISDDGRVWTMGLVLRMERDATKLEVLAHNFRNPYEVSVDAFGSMWQSDNDDDGNRGCRTLWVVPGGNHGYASSDGARSWQADRRPGQEIAAAHWHQDDPGVVPAGSINGAGGPTGVAAYEGGLLPDRFIGAVLDADAGRSLVYAHLPTRDGGGYALEREVLIRPKSGAPGRAGDPPNWFRPSDVCVAPDGAILVADWYDRGVGGHGTADREAYGRILRIAPADAAPPDLPRWLEPMQVGDVLVAPPVDLASPAINVRYGAWLWLLENPTGAREVLARIADRADRRTRARALWMLASLGRDGLREVMRVMLATDDVELRLCAIRAALRYGADPVVLATQLGSDPSPLIRAELARRLRDVPFERCGDALVALALQHAKGDAYYLESIGIGADGKEEALYARLLAESGDQPLKWSAKLAELAWRLHPPSSTQALLARAVAPELDPAARLAALDALAFVPDPRAAAEAMLVASEAGPADARARASWWIANRSENDWSELGLARRIGTDREQGRRIWASGAFSRGTKEVDVPLDGATTLWLVVGPGDDGTNSYDWADWIEPRVTGPRGELALSELDWISASAEWGQVRRHENAAGGPLRIAGTSYARGIGTHAASEIAFRIPEGYRRFVCRVGPDDGGTTQPGSRTRLEFEVWSHVPAKESPVDGLRARVLDASLSRDLRRAAALELAADPAGGAFVVELAAAGKLDDEMRAAVATALFRNPDVTVRALASRDFERPGSGQSKMPPIAELAALPGDRRRGAEVFLGPKAGCAACHRFRGRGGDIGPELSRIHSKFDATGLLDAILNPNASLPFGYETWLFEMKDGSFHVGFLLADGESVVLKDAAGERRVLAKGEIRSRTKQEMSLMPDSIALGLEPQDIADLRAFLLHDPFDDLALAEPIELFDGETLDGWTAVSGDGEAAARASWSIDDGVLRTTGRPSGYLRTDREFENYVLTLEWRFPDEPGIDSRGGGLLLRRIGADRVWPKSIEVALEHQRAGDIRNLGEFPMQTAVQRTDGARTAKRARSSERAIGRWNRCEIIVHGGDLRIVVNGVVQNEASYCDEVPGHVALRSTGVMEFRNLVLREILR